MRVTQGVRRGEPLQIIVDGRVVDSFAGETIAAVMMAEGLAALRMDANGRGRGLFCNMGTCMECMVSVTVAGGGVRRLRACLTDVSPGLTISTRAATKP